MTNYLVITGGSRGIGEKTIETFQKNNWHVINISRTNSTNPTVKNINIDLTKPDTIHHCTKQLQDLIQNAAQICLVHNAALLKENHTVHLDENEMREDLEINIVAPVILNKIFLPHMKPGSSIIYIGSTLSEIGVPNRASYVVAKHAIAGLMRVTCQDLAGKGITTCCICPGFTDTSMVRDAMPADIIDAAVKSTVTFGRLIEPQEIADLVYFSALHPVVNGSMLHANLGQVNN